MPPHARGVKEDDEATGGGGMVETVYLEDPPHATPFAHAPSTDEEAAHDRQLAYLLGRFQRFDVAEAKASREEDRQLLDALFACAEMNRLRHRADPVI